VGRSVWNNLVARLAREYGGLVLLLSIFVISPLLQPGYFWGAHDARHAVYFLLQFDRAIQDGILYPRWAPDFTFGYGYPIFNIYSPGAYYLAEAWHLAGLDFVAAVKVVFGLGLVFSGLAMYGYARRHFGRAGALVAAVAYLYIPYRLVDVYVRGALAESLTFVFFPLVLWAFETIVTSDDDGRAVVGGGLALAGLIFANYAIALLFIPLLAVYGIYSLAVTPAGGGDPSQPPIPNPQRRSSAFRFPPSSFILLKMIGAGLLSFALCAILLLPVATEYRFVRTDQWAGGYYDYRGHFVAFYQLFSPTWGFGISVPGPDDTLSFQLGVVPTVLAILSLGLWWRWRTGQPRLARSVLFFQLSTLVLIFLMLEVSAPLWEIFRLATFAQFPWRLLGLTTLTLAFLAGAVAADREPQPVPSPALPHPIANTQPSHTQQRELRLAAPLVLLLILGSFPYIRAEIIEPQEGPVSLAGLMRFQQSAGEMTGMTAAATRPRPPDWSPLADVYVSGKPVTDKIARGGLPAAASIVTTRHTTISEEVEIDTPTPLTLRFYTAAYPGWTAWLDGVETAIQPVGEMGQISVAVPAGRHSLSLRFVDTPPRIAGQIISGLSLLGVIVWAGWCRLRRHRKKE